jgi:hypothetical protein
LKYYQIIKVLQPKQKPGKGKDIGIFFLIGDLLNTGEKHIIVTEKNGSVHFIMSEANDR